MENDLDRIRSKLMGLSGTPLADAEVLKLLTQLLSDGGGVLIELDNQSYKLLKREGKFVIVRDGRRPASTMPPRR